MHPSLTPEQYIEHQNAKNCMFCNIAFNKIAKNKKIRHHCHMTKPESVYETYIVGNKKKIRRKCVKGNYLGPSCLKCNWEVTHKRNNISVLFHNFSGYDGPLLISGFVSDRKN